MRITKVVGRVVFNIEMIAACDLMTRVAALKCL